MSHIRVMLFGGPEVRRLGEEVVVTPYQACLLTLVAAHGSRGIPRSRIIRILWGEGDSPRARHRLRQLLHELRHRTSPDLFGEGEADPVALVEGDCDLTTWHELLAAGAFPDAARLVDKGFAARLETMPSRSFTDWLEGRRQALRSELEERAAKAWDAARRSASWHEARGAAEALYLLDPGDEERLRCVLRARAMTGDVQAARAAATAHRERAGGLEPETRQLLARVRELADEGPALEAPDAHRGPLPLVGRRDVLADLDALLDRIAAGRVELGLLTGEGGIGKTRILQEVERHARLKGLRVLGATPVEVERRLPLSALADALGVAEVRRHIVELDEPWRTIVAAFLPSHEGISTLPELPPIQESALSRRLQDAFAFLLRSLAEERPTVLLMDDLHWADDTTLAVLRSVTRRWDSCPLGIVGAARPPQGLGKRWPSGYLNYLAEAATYRRDLSGLSDDEAHELIQAAARDELRKEAVDEILALGGPNPFFLIELTRDHVEGRLQLDRSPLEPASLPMSLQQLFEQRLNGLSPEARVAAEVLATRARPTSMLGLAQIRQQPLRKVVEAVDELLCRGLVEVSKGVVTMCHELFRSATYQQISPAWLMLRHREVAHHLLTEDPPPDAELAVHFSKAGESSLAAYHGRRSAAQALENGAIDEAAHLMGIVAENDPDEATRTEALAESARLLHLSGDLRRAVGALDSAATRLRVIGRPEDALRLDIRRAKSLVELGNITISQSVEWLSSLKEHARQLNDWVGLALALDAEMHLHYLDGDLAAIRRLSEPMRICTASGSREAMAIAYSSLALGVFFGDPEEGALAARRAVTIAKEEGFSEQLEQAQVRLLAVLRCRGEMLSEEGLEVFREAQRNLSRGADSGSRFLLENTFAVAAMDAGQVARARESFARSEDALDATRVSSWRHAHHHYNLGVLRLMEHDHAAALDLFEKGEEILDGKPSGAASVVLNAGIGLCHLYLGDLSEARRRADDVPKGPPSGSFNSVLPLTFQCRTLRRTGRTRDALDLIEAESKGLRARLPVAWLQSQVLLLEHAVAIGVVEDFAEAARDAIELGHRLGMPFYVHQMQRLLGQFPGEG